jgi:hypothetical protein
VLYLSAFSALCGRRESPMTTLLVISGSMGAGKTAVMGETSDLLLARGLQHAAIDLDMVQTPLLPSLQAHQLHVKNVEALFENCRNAGIDRFIVAVALENASQLADLKSAARADAVTVCRLTASHQTMADRLRAREPGTRQQEFIDRARSLDVILDRAATEDFSLSNEARSITEVATLVLQRAGWI